MNWSRRLAPAFLFAALLIGPGHARAQKFQGRQLVQASLIADTSAVVPGKPFTAGLLLKMVPSWHTYWQYPGDAGIPTEIKWHLPPGWKAGPMQWPIPLKLTEPGDIQIYGYHDEVLLMMQLTPPAKIAEKSVHLAGDADWLVCAKICIPGDGKVQLDLPVAGSATAANQELFARFRAQLPKPLPSGAEAALQWTRGAEAFRLAIADKSLAQKIGVDFFPLPKTPTVIGHPKRETAADVLDRLHDSFRDRAARPEVARWIDCLRSSGLVVRRSGVREHRDRGSDSWRQLSPAVCSSICSSVLSAVLFSTSCRACCR